MGISYEILPAMTMEELGHESDSSDALWIGDFAESSYMEQMQLQLYNKDKTRAPFPVDFDSHFTDLEEFSLSNGWVHNQTVRNIIFSVHR
jgi:hypothetical protein